MSLQKFIGTVIFIAGLTTVYAAGQLSGSFSEASGALVGGAVAVLVGYCVIGYHKPTG